jgi:hypothetical protein
MMRSSTEEEKRWRAGLELVGRSPVAQYLRVHPGLPDDPVSDLPLHPPYPSRQFCERWCAQSEMDLIKGYGNIIVMGTLMLVILVSVAMCQLSSVTNTMPGAASRGAGGLPNVGPAPQGGGFDSSPNQSAGRPRSPGTSTMQQQGTGSQLEYGPSSRPQLQYGPSSSGPTTQQGQH